MKKVCSRWIPHNLTEAQKTDRVTWCNDVLTRFKHRPSLVLNIVTCDETWITWIYCYDFKAKQQSTVWVYRDEAKPTKVASERSASKRMIDSFLIKLGTLLLLLCRIVVL
ncbi:Histone-lysine N-methyltransferase SETMAR [Eumeta japonica]|uniref:Histone-lysine N-methyltransferase SETMAR n=1 Tax=Eumeta variegata TaxID=151549 RepID=A0A4C1VVD0_EUMVA|nr:Histone-lysine N-methyltransferase SETMAR [Eumeta japonica]